MEGGASSSGLVLRFGIVVPGGGLWREGVVPSAMLKTSPVIIALEVRNKC